MSEMDTPLDHAQEEAMPLVEWALTSMGHCNPEEEYANVIESTVHLEIICFVTGPPLARLPKPTKSCFDFMYEAECSMYTLRALTGQSRTPGCPLGAIRGKRYNLGSERGGELLRYIIQPWFQDDLGVAGPEFQASRVNGKGLQVSYLLDRHQC